jgi:hypothetical protein
MEPILNRARAGRNTLEQVADAIPGFRGYREKELRRDADRLQREYLAARLEETRKGLDALALAVSRAGALDAINDIETARKRLDKAVARIRYADRGYSGFFDPVKVDEATLDQVYQSDLSLLAGVDVARAAVAARGEAAGGPALAALLDALEAIDSRLSDREAVLRGIQ